MKYLKKFNENGDNFNNFNLEDFKKINTFQKRKEYCDKYLIKINSGTSRIVYKFNNKCLKLAKSKMGYIQNNNEDNDFLQRSYGNILSEVYDSFYENDNCIWLISEIASKTNENNFEKIVGISFKLYVNYISYRYYSNRPELDRTREFERKHKKFLDMDDINNNEEKYKFSEEVSQLIADADIAVGDLGRIVSYGEVVRDGITQIVIVDYGADDEYIEMIVKKRLKKSKYKY